MSNLRDSLRGPERPPFETALAFWRESLAERALGGPMRWLFRENVTLGHDRDPDDSATLCFQRLRPRFDERHAREVYGLASREEPRLHFTPLAATPDELLVTLSVDVRSDLDVVHRADWGLWFDVEPAFHTFSEVESEAEWLRATRDDGGRCRELDGILLGQLDPVGA